MMKTLLGTGILGWNRSERISDRYGFVFLLKTPMDEEYVLPECLDPFDQQEGQLLAVIRENRPSNHIGDLFRGFTPPDPPLAPGTEILLGTGRLVQEEAHTIGLLPDDGRDTDWLSPEALYQVHNQTVDLFFQPNQKESEN